MTLTREQVVDLLSVAAAYDSRKPNPDTVLAWTEAAGRGRWDYQGALTAIHEHYAESAEWIMPAHITTRLKAVRQQPPHLPTQRDPLAVEGYDRPRRQLPAQRQADPAHVRSVMADLAREMGWEQRDRPLHEQLSVRCPHCHATPGQKCTRPTRGGRVELDAPHPARIEAAEEAQA